MGLLLNIKQEENLELRVGINWFGILSRINILHLNKRHLLHHDVIPELIETMSLATLILIPRGSLN
jgi:hypothetical protein